MKINTIIISIILLISCKKDITIETTPTNAIIELNGEIYNSPIMLQIEKKDKLRISKEGYNNLELQGSEILKSNVTPITLNLTPIVYKVNINVPGKHTVLIDNEIVYSNLELPEGKYQLKIRKKGYFEHKEIIKIPEQLDISPKLFPKYKLINKPSNLNNVYISGKQIEDYTPFTIDSFPAKISISTSNEYIDYIVNKRHINKDGEIDLVEIINEFNKKIATEYDIKIDSNWITILDNIEESNSLSFIPMGWEEIPSKITKQNKIVKETRFFYPDFSIANPTKELIGSNFVVEFLNDIKTYQIDEDFYNDNLQTINVYDEDENDTIQEYLEIGGIDLQYPYNIGTIQTKIQKNDKIIDNEQHEIGNDIRTRFIYPDYSIYSEKRKSIFDNNIFYNSSTKYFYADK